MKAIAEMSVEEVAALICETLAKAGVVVTLTGGACVSIWSEGRYVSRDLDFIEEGPVPRRKVKDALAELGFVEKNRYFVHPDSEFLVEFPTGPLMVGDERIERVATRQTATGILRLLSPADCIKDRLMWFFLENDRQALEQAVDVGHSNNIDLEDIRRWAINEGEENKFMLFAQRLERMNSPAVIALIPFAPDYRQAFHDLNREWVEKYFTLEPYDIEQLENPERIIENGGEIWFALLDGETVGTGALYKKNGDVYEIAKMAVKPGLRGKGIGAAILEKLIERFQVRGGKRLVLATNAKLKNAIALYERFGFRHYVPDEKPEYARANVFMKWKGGR